MLIHQLKGKGEDLVKMTLQIITTSTRNQQLTGGGSYNTKGAVFTAPPPPVQYISPPQPDQTNSLLQSFIAWFTSRLLNESTIPNRTNMTYDEPI